MAGLQSYPVYFDCEELDEKKKKTLQTYFQIGRKSGGGECGSITRECGLVHRVDFKDREAQQRVLQRPEHRVEVAGSPLVLRVWGPGSTAPSSLHYSSFTSSLPSGGEEHKVKLNQYLLQYLEESPQANNFLTTELQSLQSTVKLCPENEKALVRSAAQLESVEAITIWKKAVESVFEKIESLYQCHFVVEADQRLLLLKSCNTCEEQGEDKVYSDSKLVIVVGTQTDVQARLKHVNDCHEKIRGGSFTRKRRLDKAKYHLLGKDIELSLAKTVPNLRVTEGKDELVFEGTAEEINKAHDIIDDKENMVKEQTVCNVSNKLLSFLNRAYCGKTLRTFLTNEECVFIDLKPTKINMSSLFSDQIDQTTKALKEKFIEITQDLNYLEVPLELKKQLKSIEKETNEQGDKVHVDFAKNQVVLLGHSKEVKELHAVVMKFIKEQSKVEDRVQVPFLESMEKLPELLTLNGIDSTGVKFNLLESGFVTLEGPSSAVSQVRHFLQSLVKETVIVDKPGAQRYYKSQNGGEKLLSVGNSHKCIIELQDATAASSNDEVIGRYTLKQGLLVTVCVGDITKQEADAFVNAADEDLRHNGGVALALSNAAGPAVQKECNDLVKNNGKVRTGDVVVTSGGKLRCKKLLHAVGPKKQNASGKERVVLEETVLSALVLAESLDLRSIALPCISSGVFGVPVGVCSEAIVSAVRVFGLVEGRCMCKITLIDKKREVVESLKAACDRLLRDVVLEETVRGSVEEQTPIDDSVKVEIIQGTIENQQVDCVVCPMLGAQPSSLRVGRALQSVAGAALEIRFKQVGGAPQPADTVLVDGLPGLTNAVIFLHLVNYSSEQQERAKQVLRDSIDGALRSCEERGFSSVALPVLGPGAVLQFPLHTAALVLLQEIHTFEKRRAPKTPFLIRIVIHPDDKDASKAFQIAQQTVHLKGFTNYANPNHASFYCHVSSSVSEVSALMGNVKLQIVQGDIIHEKTDIIVNSTGFNKEPAGISKAILTAAGPNVKAEFNQVRKTADHLCCTGAGLLGCRKIIHVHTDRTVQGIIKNCKKVLKRCENEGHASVTFPAINTGIGGMNHSTVSKAMLDAIATAITELNPKSLSLIRIVILLQPVYDAFRAELDNRFGQVAPPQNWKGKLKSKFKKLTGSETGTNISPTKPRPAVLSVIGCSMDTLSVLNKTLEDLVQSQLVEKEFHRQEICRLDKMEVETVQAKARELGVSLDFSNGQKEAKMGTDSGENTVILRGLAEDVFIVADLINSAIKNGLRVDLLEKKEESLAKEVQWMFLDDGEDWESFSSKQNYHLEEAHNKREVFVDLTIKGNKVKVNVIAPDATDIKTGKKYGIKRCKTETDIELPEHWSPMAGERFKKVEVDPTSKEYQDIAQGFYKTAKHKIHKIERVQNLFQWSSYFVMRQKMLMKNGEAELGEKYLYHGTTADSSNCIEKDRFDRNFTGKNAAAYGKGVYFAIEAKYSANPRYSKPDDSGLQRMYVARVLTGRHTLGKSDMKVPPPRDSDSSDKYDSLVDDLQRPQMFVIFHDDQAYPDYLITFS